MNTHKHGLKEKLSSLCLHLNLKILKKSRWILKLENNIYLHCIDIKADH